VHLPAPLHVTVLVRALDVGPRLERVWRLSCAVGEEGVRLRRDLPFEAGRPVQVELTLPDQDVPLSATGIVAEVRPDASFDEYEPSNDPNDPNAANENDGDTDADRPRPRAVVFTALDPIARRSLAQYVEERMLSA
jgi:hypothetical protein